MNITKYISVADPGCLSRIPDTNFFPDPESASKSLSILTQKWFLALGNTIRVVHPGSGSRILIFCPSRIPDPGFKKAPNPGFATLFSTVHHMAYL